MSRWLWPAVILIAAALSGVLWAVGKARAHSWYDTECCSDSDCRPVHQDEVVETDKGWKHLPTGTEFTRSQVKPSKDRYFHVCIGNKSWDRGRPYCIYILQGV